MENRNILSDLEHYEGARVKTYAMKTVEQIKDGQAIELGYNSFRDLVLNPKQDMKMNHINWCVERSMVEYADQCVYKAADGIFDALIKK